MRTFHLVRETDISGVSGSGIVAEGVELKGGKCFVHWFGDHESVNQYNNLRDVAHIHGHAGATKIVMEGILIKEVPLSDGSICLIDDEDNSKIKDLKWHIYRKPLRNNCSYVYSNIKSKDSNKRTTIQMHRLLLDNPEGKVIDHVNGDGLDNRKVNLRFCDNSQNQMNRVKIRKSTTSKWKGVGWDKKSKKWRARIGVNNKRLNLGLFQLEREAAIAYNKAALELFGEFVKLNEVE